MKHVPLSYRVPEWRPAEKGVVAERMNYHAIIGCIQDEQNYYCVRDGQRMKL
jgi:hypothetical protein